MLKNSLFIVLLLTLTLTLFSGCDLIPDFITGTEKVEEIIFDKDEITLKIGESADIYATVLPKEVEDAKLVWKSSNEMVAAVSRGRVTALSEGTTFITATSENGIYDICFVTVMADDKSDNDNVGDENPENPDPEKPNPEDPDNGDKKNVTYKVKLVTKGGMALSNHPVYIFQYEDETLYDVVSYGATNENGEASFELPNGKYAARIDMGLPKGYVCESFYPLETDTLDIVVTTKIIDDTDLAGVEYKLGSVMHDFTVTTTTGESFTLSQVLKEKEAVLINFWFSNCSFCQMEFPFMQSAYEKYSDKLAIIALNPPAIGCDTIDDIVNFKYNFGLAFDVAQDLEGIYNAFGVENYPTSIMIDRYGVVTLIEVGAVTSERTFDQLFNHFTAENYQQKLITSLSDFMDEFSTPGIQMPAGEEISKVFDGGKIEGIEYLPYPDNAGDEEKRKSWPFIIDSVELNGEKFDVIRPSNSQIDDSYSQIVIKIPMKEGDVLAFDYLASTELGADILYAVVNGKDIYSISGVGDNWQTCYTYVAEENASYEIVFIYNKDVSDSVGDDTVFLKNLRIVSEADIDAPTYIYRFAATKPTDGTYGKYADIVLGTDGYYHVNSADGPILLADLMGYTRFCSDNNAYSMAIDLYNNGYWNQTQYDAFIAYCNYASNSEIFGLVSVTEELREMLVNLSQYYGDPINENEWLEFCCYYDAYATDGKQFSDPIKGLAHFSAYEAIESKAGEYGYPNSFTYNRVIMPRGFVSRFTPTVSGTYLISSYAPDPSNPNYGLETQGWILTEEGISNRESWLFYENVDRLNTTDYNNVYMIAYLEAGKDYYIDIAFYDVYQEGTIYYRVERLGGEGYYRFSKASPSYFSVVQNDFGELTETIAGGIDILIGSDGYWYEKRTDGRLGSIIYADFTMPTGIFPNHSIESLIELGAFDFRYTEEDLYVLDYLERVGGDVERCKAELREKLGDLYVNEYAVEEVLAGFYHGKGNDETETMREYASKIIKAGDIITKVNADGTGYENYVVQSGDVMIGCLAVDDELSHILQMLMDKYTFEGVEHSWLKLCYYEQYFYSATPI